MIDESIRLRAFEWLREQGSVQGHVFSRQQLERGFPYHGRRITFVGPAGIWKPRDCSQPLSITSTVKGPYDDAMTDDGLVVYRYRGSDPNHRDNVGLREAMNRRTPLVYFLGIVPSRYLAIWPVFIVEDLPESLSCTIAVDPAYATEGVAPELATDHDAEKQSSVMSVRRYIAAFTKRRLHQTAFREQVILAYSGTCALCRLKHVELLDAAHIVPDSQPGGDPVVQNGLCLCKIHHAAYDNNFIGVSPDYQATVRPDILEEPDGPMLTHGLKELHGQQIVLPKSQSNYPNREKLDWRYQRFLHAG